MPDSPPQPIRRAKAVPQAGAGRSLSALAGPLIRALHQVDSACMRALSQSYDEAHRARARLEVSMWLPLHRALTSHLGSAPAAASGGRIDALLADDLLAFVDDVLLWVADVEAGGTRRLGRYLITCRQRIGELQAFGGDVQALQQQLAALESKRVDAPNDDDRADTGVDVDAAAEAQALQVASLHAQALKALNNHAPRTAVSLLDGLML